MDFSLRRVGDQNIYYHEAGEDSAVQLVFVPGGFNPDLWENQLNYFSREYRTVAFSPTKSNKGFKGEKKALENVLEKEEISNAVLVSGTLGNRVVQEVENHQSVVGTVLTGIPDKVPDISETLYSLFWAVNRNPKLMKKILFSGRTDYSVAREFSKKIKPPEYENFRSFAEGYRIETPRTYSLSIHADDDRFSSIEKAKNMAPHSTVSVIKRAGTFSFFEKPQEYNKVLSDFLVKIEKAVKDQELVAAKKKNKSLWEYEKEKKKMRVKR